MPTYTIASPTGEEYEIEAPQGASQQQAFEFFKREHSAGRVKPKQAKQLSTQEFKDRAPEWAKAPVGVLETGVSMLAGMPSQIAGGLLGLGKLATGQGLDEAANTVNRVQQENFGFGAFEPLTDVGKRYSKATTDVMAMPGEKAGDVGAAIGKVLGNEELGRLSAKLPVDVAMNFLPLGGVYVAGKKAMTPKKSTPLPETTSPVLDKLDQPEPATISVRAPEQLELPLETSPQAIAEMQARGTQQMDLFASDTANRGVGGRLGETIPEPIYSAERTHDFLSRAKQDEIDATPYGDVPAHYGSTLEHGRIDENGMPIRADLSMEAQNLQNPLQRNLWGDELGPSQGASKSLTSALDSMPPGNARDLALSQLSGIPQKSLVDKVNTILNEGTGGLSRTQRGMLDFESIGNSFRSINRRLSQLTDQPWVKAAFPAHRFETNKDGSPKVMLHGTTQAFNDRPRILPDTGYEGLHAGYGGAATLKASPGPKSDRVGYSSRNLRFAEQGTSPAVYPVALRKGNYPRLEGDYGSWEPLKLADSRQFKLDLAKVTGKGFYAIDDFMESYKERILNRELSPKDENILFAKMLKNELDVDGFFYPNTYESAKRTIMGKSGIMKSPQRARNYADKLGYEDSVVVYDENNMVSLYDAAQQAPSMNSGMSRGQRGGFDYEILPKAFRDFVDNWVKAGGNLSHVGVSRMLDDHPVKLTETQRGLLEHLYPETAKTYQEKINKAWLSGDAEKAGRWGKRYDDALIQEAVLKHHDAFGKGFKSDGQRYDAKTGFWAGRVAAQEQAQALINSAKKNQRGALKFDDVGDIVQKFVKGVAKSVEQQRLPVSAREKLLQTVQRDNSFVLRPMETENIVAKALQEPDSKMNKYTQSGAISAGDKVGSTLVRETGRWMNWARSTGEKYFRERVKPVEHVLSAVPKADLETAMQVMTKEMFNKERFSDQRLLEAGMTKDAMFARQKLIEAYDVGITTLNQTREKLGMRPVKPMEAYFSSQFNGDYLISVVDSSGRPVGLATAATRAEANKALAWIKKNMPEHENVSIVDRRTSAANNRTPRDVSSLYEGLMDVFKDTPMEAELRQMMEGRAEMQAYTERGFYNHFKNKTGIRFFIGDRPWLDQRQNAIQAAQAQVKYLKDLYNWIPTQEAMAQLKGVFTDEQLMRSQPNNLAYAKASMDNFMGISKSITKPMEDFLAGGIAKVSTGELSKYVGSLKSLTYLKQLGASVGYAIATPLQMLLYAPSFHNMLSGGGIKHNPVVTMAKTLKDVQAILVTHSLDKVGTSIHDKALSPFANDALRYMEDNGIITKSLYDEYAQLGTHKAIDLANQTLGSTITAPDKLARLLGFMSFAHHLKDGRAPLSDLEIFRRAAELTDKAAVPLERHNRPLVADKLGLAGELAFMYKAPVFMAFNNLLELGSHAHKTGNTTPLLLALGATIMLGGAMSLPGMSEMDSGFELLKDLNAKFGSKDLAVYLKDKGVKQTMLQHLPDAVTYGALSASTNTQLSTRFGNEAINLQDPFNGMVPGAQTVKEIASSTWGLLMKPDYTQLQQSLHSMGLPLTRGLQESYGDEFTAGDMGGKRSVLRPSDIRGQETVYARNEADQSRRKLGLMSLDEAKARDIDYRSRQDEKRMQEVRNRAAKEFFFNAMKKQDTSDDVITFLQAGGEPDELLREFDTRIQKRALTPEVRELLKATKLREIQAIVQKMKMGRQYAN